MPVYLVTDNNTGSSTMVEASRPAGALSALIENRFDVSPALDAADALNLMWTGVVFLRETSAQPAADPLGAMIADTADEYETPPVRPSLEAFAAAADADDDLMFRDAGDPDANLGPDPDYAREDRDERRQLTAGDGDD